MSQLVELEKWLCKEMPAGTVIGDPKWWAHKIMAAVSYRDAQAAPVQQEPVFWYRPCSDGAYEGPIHNSQIEDVRKNSGAWIGLHTHPTPEAVRKLVREMEMIQNTITKQLELISERALGDFLNKRPVVQALTSLRNRAKAALDAVRGK